ncbi:MDR family MFS transporter [Lactiplantibacillus mudanjiangensis]|uniref:Transport protein [Lactobacillus plantarum JDM1] n=1 Tax=Lactiplantibacillus mudanjiangensis TaxID=1296538 RepID=A0A660DTP2_9LACO|nr:MFS transporter [Lactiplantibacillus mudanjiangensis]VDG20919.1 transport protein [Lactobacillus plantarum JDM1] [Lactiplantibacillus mudanjiangensis]VDG22652.1 transport protein [Lactobacillus plantarum JDM1] [Lactiplantibacillus mudanjiangensis]VDG26808.1 transport protein [Lactobacillus plantarum JDM1] [Lactiplantibacillus mudanjiangensis]VDG31951.1 transport protein [Lactobacillus plantarum JDM1] [Lactiplantibacillus mudanjiangensis]
MVKKSAIGIPWLIAGQFMNNIGMSFIWPLTTIYMHNVLGKSLTETGVVLMLNSIANVCASTIGGRIFDRHNPYTLLLLGIGLNGAANFSLIWMHGWPWYPILLVITGFASGWLNTMFNALAASVPRQKVRRTFTLMYLAANLGVVFGTLFVGIVYQMGMAKLFSMTTSLFVIFLVIAIFKYNVDASQVTGVDPRQATASRLPKANGRMIWTFFISLFMIWLVYEQWVSNLSVYMTNLGLPLRNYSLLWTVNAGLLVVIQSVLSLLGDRIKSLYHQFFFGMLFVGLSFLSLISAHDYAHFIFAMVLLTIGEATWSPAMPTLVSQLSPLKAKGRYQGLVQAFSALGRSLGPLFGGVIIDNWSYKSLFLVAFMILMVVLAVNVGVVHWNQKRAVNYLQEPLKK